MATQQRISILSYLGALVVAGVVGAAVGFFIGVGFAILGTETGHPSWNDWPPRAALIGAVLGCALVLLFAGMDAHDRGVEEDQQREAERLREDEERQRRAKAAEERLAGLKKTVLFQAHLAVDNLSQLPSHLEAARAWTQQAVVSYQDGAFSPFWSAVERAYAELGLYRAAADAIVQRRTFHTEAIEKLADVDREASRELSVFPVDLDVARVGTTADDAAASLNGMVYEAQRDPTFAMIWEQRRTTAAVVEGFQNLESAVDGMRASLSASLHSVEQALHSTGSDTADAVRRLHGSVAVANHEAVSSLRELVTRSEGIRQELYRQNWGHYPLLH